MAADNKLFSHSLEAYKGDVINVSLTATLESLRKSNEGELSILVWDNYRIAVPLTVPVAIPPLGTYQDIDIREEEPVLLVFDLEQYPIIAPMVLADRLDFPKNKLAHLYIAQNNRPPAFCYVRGNRDEWYANKRIQDLLIRISNWLQDAANGSLTQDGNQFDPLRLENYEGVIIYDYDQIVEIIEEDNSIIQNEHIAIGLFESNGGFRLVQMLTQSNLEEIFESLKQDKAKSDTDPNRKHYRLGYFLWSESSEVFEEYTISFPETWAEFKEICFRYKICWEKLEEFFINFDNSGYIVFPVIVAIKRPAVVIGFSANIEFFNFRFSIDSKEQVNGKISDTAKVTLSSHNQPLTTSKANAIAGLPKNYKFSGIVFGCGALGSKIIMHLARAGMTDLALTDPDDISPHNLVRHALLPDQEGKNKATALVDSIKRLYPTEELGIIGLPRFPRKLMHVLVNVTDWLLDFTASPSFFTQLILTDIPIKSKIVSAFISDFGNMGVFFREGNGRNPRIDDLKVYLYSLYHNMPEIKDWLEREQKKSAETNLTVSVGVGCNSETIILSDEKVSLHAAVFAGTIKREAASPAKDKGKIIISRITEDDNFMVKTTYFDVPSFDVFTAVNDPSWIVRFKYGLIPQIKEEMQKAAPIETGGIFIGMVNHKTKTIHVTGLIDAPPDSEANPVCFFRGHQGLPEQVSAVVEGSGGQLGYVGEWHSHPHGPDAPSETDMANVSKFKTEFDQLITPLPVFMVIVTPNTVLPYVF